MQMISYRNNVPINSNPNRKKYAWGRLGVKSLFSFTLDGGSTAPKETDSTRLEVPKSTLVDSLGSTPTSKRTCFWAYPYVDNMNITHSAQHQTQTAWFHFWSARKSCQDLVESAISRHGWSLKLKFPFFYSDSYKTTQITELALVTDMQVWR